MMKLFLIDGHALIFKMYYAFLGRPMVNSKGEDTSILFGFTRYLLELIDKEKPTHVAVAFDPPGGTFRNQLYPQYKANRGETPRLPDRISFCPAGGRLFNGSRGSVYPSSPGRRGEYIMMASLVKRGWSSRKFPFRSQTRRQMALWRT